MIRKFRMSISAYKPQANSNLGITVKSLAAISANDPTFDANKIGSKKIPTSSSNIKQGVNNSSIASGDNMNGISGKIKEGDQFRQMQNEKEKFNGAIQVVKKGLLDGVNKLLT
jgi:hypothetical protein